jgi:two-component system, OmpR family, heavy metal sensor histidine kinase CusS
MNFSIRWRLTLWNTVGLAVMLLAFAGLVYGLLLHALYEQIDQKLLGALGQLEQDARMATDPGRLRYWIYEWREHENLSAVAYDAEGKILARTEELASDSIPPAPSVVGRKQRLQDRAIPILGRQRVLEGGVHLGDQPCTVIVMAPLEDVDHALGELRTVLLTAIPVVLFLSGCLGYLLARKALAPMERLRRSTEEITADHLDRRLPVINPQDEFGRLTQTFNAMIGRLERSFAEIRRFTADASHELRTPLTAIRTEAEVALARPLDLAEHQQLLGSILEECGRLTRLTDQLLALAREDARAARQAHELVDLATLIGDVTETMRPLAEAKGLHLGIEVNGAARVCGDAARLREVFFNILDNSIKYTPEGGEVDVWVGHNGPEAVVTVRDTGIGIPAEHVPHVFDRFYRVDRARSRAEGGTGLGLSIAQSIVVAHGGQIELASTSGQGTCCTVRLPTEPKRY